MILELSGFEICWIKRKWDFRCDYMFIYVCINVVWKIIGQYPSSLDTKIHIIQDEYKDTDEMR